MERTSLPDRVPLRLSHERVAIRIPPDASGGLTSHLITDNPELASALTGLVQSRGNLILAFGAQTILKSALGPDRAVKL